MFSRLIPALILSLAACGGSSQPASVPTDDVAAPVETETATADPIAAAVAAPTRPEEDRADDALRQPAEVLAFFGIEPGMAVADLMAGGGYYSEILAGVVGPEGKVYLQNNAAAVEKFAGEAVTARMARAQLPQIERTDAELDALPFEPESLDAALMILFYHDTVWMKVDRDKMNASIFAALEPGGIYGIIDHSAEAGSGLRDVESIHRIDRDVLVSEIEKAGFVLEEESQIFSHPEDDRTKNVFDPAIRRNTDRFVLRFRKPL